MKRIAAVVGGLVVGVGAMLLILNPWDRRPPAPRPVPAPGADAPSAARDARQQLSWGEVEAAQRRLADAAAIDPSLPEIPLIQGHVDMLRRDFAGAKRSYDEALRRRAPKDQALAGRAAARHELGEYAGAIEDATASLEAGGEDPGPLFTRAAAYGALGRHEEALRDWSAYLARQPDDADAWNNRANAHARLGNAAAAEADRRRSADVSGPRDP